MSRQQPQHLKVSTLQPPQTTYDSHDTGAGSPIGSLNLRHTNVSSPSVVEPKHKPSLQSVTASEDYYSLSNSGSSSHSDERRQAEAVRSTATITRYQTPPSRYRTPLQSRDNLTGAGIVEGDAEEEEGEPEVRKTPMRGQGRRRQSNAAEYGPVSGYAPESSTAPILREGGVRRKPVPSTVMERGESAYGPGGEHWPRSDEDINPENARSSVAKDLGREISPPTPGVDDTPYIRFALDQLTRDEEVRGSRRYRGLGSGVEGNYPYVVPPPDAARLPPAQIRDAVPIQAPRQSHPAPREPLPEGWRSRGPPEIGILPYEMQRPAQMQKPALVDVPPPRNPQRLSRERLGREPQAPVNLLDEDSVQRFPQPAQRRSPPALVDTRFLPVSNESKQHPQLNFIPGILRPLALGLFVLLLLAYLACLLFCAIYSLVHMGIADYGIIGDGRYFVFQYLPTLLGIILFFWTVQIEVAVYRIAPFVAMSSLSPREREEGARLPMTPKGFVLPYFGHFKAKQGIAGFFMVVAWLQIWTVPLLASAFNVYYYGSPSSGQWRWIATQGAIWTVIILYLLLVLAVIMLLIWLKFGRRTTGLLWDPRSLADLVVLLERSNSLDGDEGQEPAQLGYWRTNARPNEIFHAYGISEKEARRYSLEDGRIREKASPRMQAPLSRFSADPEDAEREEVRHSREKMLPRPTGSEDDDDDSNGNHGSSLIPWFLRSSMAALWVIIAVVLLLAFLIVSYLPSTRVSDAFVPEVPAPVNKLGFSGTNFLYSFVPAILAMLCLLFWMDIDYAHRRLQAYESLSHENGEGELAERSLLLSYPAEFPGFVTATALVNGHWKVAVLSFVTLIAATLPLLAGGVFWAQFYVGVQRTRISADMPAYYALTVFATLYALAYFLIFPSRQLRNASQHFTYTSSTTAPSTSFTGVLHLVRQSRMLDDVAFHAPSSKIQLVTRLLSAAPGARISQHEEAAQSKVSLADSVRGFGRARQQALGGLGVMATPRYALARHTGRSGEDFWGVDRVRK